MARRVASGGQPSDSDCRCMRRGLQVAAFVAWLPGWVQVSNLYPLRCNPPMLGTDCWTPFFNQMSHGIAELAPEVRSWQWKERVLDSQRPVMIHLWSKAHVPTRSEALAPVIDEVVRTFDGKIDAVRGLSASPCNCAFVLRPTRHACFITGNDIIFKARC